VGFSERILGCSCAKEIETIVLFGIATSGVVLSTLLEASDADYRLVVIEDCCADLDAELHAWPDVDERTVTFAQHHGDGVLPSDPVLGRKAYTIIGVMPPQF